MVLYMSKNNNKQAAKKTTTILIISLFVLISICGNYANADEQNPTIEIRLEPFSTAYEGDTIKCDITGNS